MLKYLLLCIGIMFFTLTFADNKSISSEKIIQTTITALPKCLHYHIPTHFCLWINEWGKIDTTPVLDHYLPDLVVSVFNKPGDNPWLEINKSIDVFAKPIQNKLLDDLTGIKPGSGNHSFTDVHEQNVVFKEIDVIGNPALFLIPSVGLLPSNATSFLPYYQSMVDSVLWRGLPPAALPEEATALGLNVIHHVGTGLENWGGLYPHEGKVFGCDDLKVSQVIASRGADLLNGNNYYGHIYKSLSLQCGEHCKVSPIEENSKETYFQMIYPKAQNNCYIMGTDDSYSADMLNENGSYIWVVWRHYQGCADGDGKYIGRT